MARTMRKRLITRGRRLARFCLGAPLIAAAGAPASEEAQTVAAQQRPVVEIETDLGAITVELRPQRAPRTVANFLALVDDGFYDGLVFHRVIAGFMIQAGGFDADMKPRPAPRTVPNESIGGLANERGTIAMARTSDPDSAGAQFYINMEDSTRLNARRGKPGYTVFGRVTAGLEVAERIEAVPTHKVNGRPDVPRKPVTIVAVRRVTPREP